MTARAVSAAGAAAAAAAAPAAVTLGDAHLTIRFLDEGARKDDDEPLVEYVAGPLADRRERLARPPHEISVPEAAGIYRRSLKCAEDGALRYVWQEWPPAD